MNNALIVSYKFHPGHISHLVASYKQMEELGYESLYLINKKSIDYIQEGANYSIPGQRIKKRPSIALFLFPHPKNVFKILELKVRWNSKVIYVFHEPLTKYKVYKKAGFSYFQLLKLAISNLFDVLIVMFVDSVVLPSKKAITYYQENKLYFNRNYTYIPLMYDDERTETQAKVERQYISYIGTVAADHSFVEFLDFVRYAIKENLLPQMHFMIATASEFDVPDELKENQRIYIKKGKPLTDKEINDCYASTKVIWNAYNRMTQSGVLAKAFMFGTPAIMMRHNLNEFAHDGEEVVAIDDNKSYEQIENAIRIIVDDFDGFSNNCRNQFLQSFYYKNYNEKMAEICARA